MDIRFDKGKNIAHIKMSGELGQEEILAAFDLTVSDKRYKNGMGRLWDFREVDLSSLKTETVVKMAQYSLRFPPGINDVKVAFVVSRDFEFGMTRMFEMSSKSKTPIHVFRSVAEAEEWMMEE